MYINEEGFSNAYKRICVKKVHQEVWEQWK